MNIESETARRPANLSVTVAEVARYYNGKTQAIIDRYGPGPRLHYHTGWVDAASSACMPVAEIRRSIAASQERMLSEAARSWQADTTLSGCMLDAGCGLGGGTLYWAQEHGARVVALTNATQHVPIVRQFVSDAGLEHRIDVRLGDVHAYESGTPLDAVVAFESSCYFDQSLWMRRMSSVLRPGGYLFVADCFLGREALRAPVDSYWKTRMKYVDQYLDFARDAGFEVMSLEDVSARAVGFWDLTLQLMDAAPSASEMNARLDLSRREHRRLRDAFDDGGLRYALVAFRLPSHARRLRLERSV